MEEMRNEFGERVFRVENAEEFLAAVQVEAQAPPSSNPLVRKRL